MGAVLEREGLLAEAERQLAHAEHFFRDDVETVHHTWLLARLARVRVARGHIEAAEMALQQAREGLDELDDAGIVRDLVDATEAELARASALAAEGEVLALPTEAELPVLRFMSSDLSAREIAGRLFLSVNTVPSRTRAPSTASCTSTPVSRRWHARRRWAC